MKINLSAKYVQYADVLPFVVSNELVEKAVEMVVPFWELEIGQLFKFAESDFSDIVPDDCEMSVAQYIWLQEFPKWLKSFVDICNKLTIQQTAEQKQASASCIATDWQESMLLFARAYFGLHSFAEAERVKVSEYLMAKKDDYNTKVFERNLTNIQRQKTKK